MLCFFLKMFNVMTPSSTLLVMECHWLVQSIQPIAVDCTHLVRKYIESIILIKTPC